jgi:hypothetical protein
MLNKYVLMESRRSSHLIASIYDTIYMSLEVRKYKRSLQTNRREDSAYVVKENYFYPWYFNHRVENFEVHSF